MRFGLGLLRLSPDAFWGATPLELLRAFEGVNGVAPAAPLGRAALNALMRRFPDPKASDGSPPTPQHQRTLHDQTG